MVAILELSDIILTGDYLRTIPAYFGLNWLSGFKGKDFKVIFDKISLISIFRQMHSYLSLTWNNYSNISADSVGKCGFNGSGYKDVF
jgi:hypothetical protein